MKTSLEPVIDVEAKVLILGTMPGDESLLRQQYYANPSNQCWLILQEIHQQPIGFSYNDRLKFMHDRRLALWDVLKSAEREGSSDSNIRNGQPNDFAGLFVIYSKLVAVALNGTKANKFFKRFVLNRQVIPRLKSLQLICLPSTSATPGRNVLPLDQKIQRWRVISQISNV